METFPIIQTKTGLNIQRNGTISTAQVLHLKTVYSNALLGNVQHRYTAYE